MKVIRFVLWRIVPTLAVLPAAALGAGKTEQVTRLIQPVIDAGLVPGAVVGVYENGTAEVIAVGHLTPDGKAVPDGQTLYEIGSITKVFTGILLAQAIQRKEVTLDDPLSKRLPAGTPAPKRDGQEILLWHLATHTSGLPRIPDGLGVVSDNPYRDYGTKQLWAFVGASQPSVSPGKEYAYSNLGAGLLGCLLSEAAGKPYAKLLEERITGPLGMSDTVVVLSSAQQRRLAPPYASGKQVSTWEFDALVGCGGIRSTVADLLKLIAATLAGGGSEVQQAIKLTTERRFTLPAAPAGIGLGWHIAQDGSTLWHNGQTGGYHSAMFVDPVHRTGVVVLSNGADPTIDVAAERIAQMLAGLPAQPPVVRPSIALPAEQLDLLVGEYPSSFGFTITITRDADALMAQVTGQAALRVWPSSPTQFFYRDVEAELEFELDSASGGKARAVSLLQNGMKYRCERRK